MEPLRDDDPDRVGPYAVTARLGGGGMGQVFLGRSPGGRPVAVKVVRAEFCGDAHFRRRFATEVGAARRVGGFYTAQVVDADPEADRPWLVTAYVAGPSLQAAVAEHGPLPVPAVRILGAGLAEGLAAVHACGLVHRDLKPGNVILAADGPRVIDFGIARALEEASCTATGAVVGTVSYMAPEQARGERDIEPSCDVFALGSVLAWAATGAAPFGRGPSAVVLNRILREEPDLSRVPGELRELIAACLTKDPAGRPGVEEVMRACAGSGAPAADGAWLPAPVHAMIGRMSPGTSPATTADSPAAPTLPPPVPAPPAPPAAGGRGPRALVLAAVAAAAVLALTIAVGAALAANGSGEGSNADPAASAVASQGGGTPNTAPQNSPAHSRVVGRINDAEAGFSYVRLGAPWVSAGGAWTQPGMFTGGQVAPVQPAHNGASFNATSVSGVPRPAEVGDYQGPARTRSPRRAI